MLLKKNYSMLTDFYEFTMANGYLEQGVGDTIAYFDMFFRKVPDGGGYAIMAGTEQLVNYLQNLHFDDEDIAYLRSKHCFSERFLEYIRNFRFACDVWAVPEGSPIFPGEPIVTVRGPVMQAQFIETMVLLTINHQSLIATKASRMVRAAQGRAVLEFGSRRAQGADGAVLGARAAYIGGCAGTACVLCDRDYAVPAAGTMAHSWVQLFDSELDAFRAYAREYPSNCTLLVDTFNVLKSGVPNAIKVFQEELLPRGYRPAGIRIDSGDITYLSRKARKMLDEAGFPDCKICASNSLDEYIIRDMLMQGAKVDSFGVGERLITSGSEPVFGGVYKLAAVEKPDGTIAQPITVYYNLDTEAPAGIRASYAPNRFFQFLHTVTFGLFFRETVTVTLTAEDSLSGVREFTYTLSDGRTGSTASSFFLRPAPSNTPAVPYASVSIREIYPSRSARTIREYFAEGNRETSSIHSVFPPCAATISRNFRNAAPLSNAFSHISRHSSKAPLPERNSMRAESSVASSV